MIATPGGTLALPKNYRTILVHLDTSRAARHRLDVALRPAAGHSARLIGLYSAFIIERHSFYGANAGGLATAAGNRSRRTGPAFANAAPSAGAGAEWRPPEALRLPS
jgi:hypothetical protein